MTLDRENLLDHYRQMRAELLAVIDGLDDARISDPSLDGWAVKDHLLHLAFWDDVRAAEIARISAGHASLWRLTRDQEQTLGPLVYELRRHIPAEQARLESAASHQRVLDAIGSITERGLDASRYGEAGLPSRHEAAHTAWIKRWRDEQGHQDSRPAGSAAILPPTAPRARSTPPSPPPPVPEAAAGPPAPSRTVP